jgi:hypothetical protein
VDGDKGDGIFCGIADETTKFEGIINGAEDSCLFTESSNWSGGFTTSFSKRKSFLRGGSLGVGMCSVKLEISETFS